MPENEFQRQERERELWTRLLAAVEKPKSNRLVRFINAPFFLWLLTAVIITLGGGYYATYRQCVADGRSIVGAYTTYGFELNYRQREIVSAILNAKTIEDLRASLKEPSYFSFELKNKSISELLTVYYAATRRMDRSETDTRAEGELISSPLYSRFNIVLYGLVPSTVTQADLPDLQKFAVLFGEVNLVDFINRIKTVYQVECTPSNVALIALGENPVLVRAVETSFLEKQKSLYPLNVLPKHGPSPKPD